jgi:hypothetical protein
MGEGGIEADAQERPPTFIEVLRTGPFAVLYAAETQSTIGDQLARVALSVLVFQRTGSAAATALTYAATFLPAVLGGFALARIGDWLPRRAVMVGCDLLRAGLFAGMAVHGLPLPIVVALLVVAVFVGPAFAASEVSVLAATLPADRFRAATGLRMVTGQLAQVGGFALGGVLVTLLHPRGALIVDAATYVISALLIGLLLPRVGRAERRSAVLGADEPRSSSEPKFAGLWHDPRLRALIALSALAGFFVVPEGLAVPFGSQIGATTTQTGMILASMPLGGALGAALLVRFVPRARRAAVAGLMSIGCGLPLTVTALHPAWPLAWLCWFVSGALAAYQVEVVTMIVQGIPDRFRAHSLGIAGACLVGAQGIGLAGFGALAQVAGVGRSIGLAGLVGSALALLIVVGPLRAASRAASRAPAAQHRGDEGPRAAGLDETGVRGYNARHAMNDERVSPESDASEGLGRAASR